VQAVENELFFSAAWIFLSAEPQHFWLIYLPPEGHDD
jgi:hypothetical protein